MKITFDEVSDEVACSPSKVYLLLNDLFCDRFYTAQKSF